jgi:agmatine deiminase
MRMPAEWEPHERTLMAWPTSVREAALWGRHLDDARSTYAEVARAIARFEPVTVVANRSDVEDARARCGTGVEVLDAPIDDSWLRDNGPILVWDGDERRGIHFGFNAWGGSYSPVVNDRRIAAILLEHLEIERVDATDLVLEGGSIAVDGAGTLVTTERCLLNPNRNPTLRRSDIEDRLAELLGIDRFVWLADGIAEDEGTDGHVDNVVAFTAPGRVVLQGCSESANPNARIARDNRRRLEEAGIEVVEITDLPYTYIGGRHLPVPYGNFYVANRVIVVPVTDDWKARWLDLIGEQFGDREVVPVHADVLAHGGGGVHCITQQVVASAVPR